MLLNKLLGDFNSMKSSSSMLLISNVGLVLTLMVSLSFNMMKDTVVMNNLNESCEPPVSGLLSPLNNHYV
jgi:hypothetical protein